LPRFEKPIETLDMATVTQLMALLEERGHEPAVVKEHGIDPLVAHAGSRGIPVEPWLEALEQYVAALALRTTSFWSPLRFVLLPLARCAGDDPTAFARLLQRCATLLEKLKDDTTRTEQYGLAAAAGALPNRPADFETTLSLALELAEQGHDPGWFLQLVVPPLAAAEPKGFTAALARQATLLRALSSRSIFIGFQAATGLAAIAQAAPGEESLPWLELLARFPNPSGVLEHGVTRLLQGELPPSLVTRALTVALELTDRSIEPLPMLQVPAPTEQMLDLAQELARAGVDPAGAMQNGVTVFTALGWMGDEGERLIALSKSLQAHGLTQRVFQEAIFELQHLEARLGLGLRGLELVEALAAHGFEPTLTLHFGLNRALQGAEEQPFLAPASLDLASALVEAGIAPDAALSYAVRPLAELAKGNQAELTRLMRGLQSLIIGLHSMGLDSASVLFHDVRGLIEVGGESATFIALGAQLQKLMRVWLDAGLDPAPLVQGALPAALRASFNRPWVLTAALELVERLVADGRAEAALEVLKSGLASASLAFGHDEKGLRSVLSTLEVHTRSLPAAMINPVSAAACIVARRDTEFLAALLDVMVSKLAVTSFTPAVRDCAARAMPVMAALVTDVESLASVVDAVLETTAQVPPERLDAWLDGALEAASSMPFEEAVLAVRAQARFATSAAVLNKAASVSRLGKTSAALVRGLARIEATAQRLTAPHVFELAVSVALKAAEVDDFCARLDVLEPLLQKADESAQLLDGLRRIEPTLARLPSSWAALVLPLLRAHRGRAGPLLMSLAQLGSRHVSSEADCDVLREIVTQLGVRSLDALQGLIVPGLYSGAIGGLASHGALLRAYLREVGFHDPAIFAQYAKLHRDPSLSDEVRKSRTQALRQRIEALRASVHRGELSAAELEDPLLGVALLHVFPPSVSVTQERVVELVRRFEDRPADVARWSGPATVPIELPSGGYRFRDGHPVDRKPWALAQKLFSALPDRTLGTDALLGWALLRSWAAGQVARPGSRRIFLAELLHSLGGGQSSAGLLDSPSALLSVRDLLADRCAGRIERVLLAARDEDPATYARLVEARLAPRTVPGPKLITSVLKTVTQWRDGLTEADAQARLRSQLPALALDENGFTALRRCEKVEEVSQVLAATAPKPFTPEPGREVGRIHAELFGQDLQAMQQVLFGHGGRPGALEYHQAAGSVSLTLEVTKRRAHAAVGFCEGVCVASDEQLWSRPEFLQAVLWNSEGIAQGGMHLLIVTEGDEQFLSLPGINPSSALLEQVEPSQVVGALLDAARTLAERWKLSGVWLPDAPVILSNRHTVYSAIAKLDLPLRKTAWHPFSFNPFAYSFSSVWLAR